MSTQSKHVELDDELESQPAKMAAMSGKNAFIKGKLTEVNGQLGKVDLLENKMNTVDMTVIKGSQV